MAVSIQKLKLSKKEKQKQKQVIVKKPEKKSGVNLKLRTSKFMKLKKESSNYGRVLSIKDGIVTSTGLETVCFGELVCFNNNKDIVGMVLTLRKKKVEIVMLQNEKSLQIGDFIYRMKENNKIGKFPSVKVGFELLGKHINALGKILNEDDLSKEQLLAYHFLNNETRNVFKKAPGIIQRESVTSPFYTGIQLIDAFFPIGCGQRELLIGDKFTGKTTIGVTSILNQKEFNQEFYNVVSKNENLVNYIKREHIFCIYAGVGQRRSSILRIYNLLKKEKSMSYTCIISSTSSCKASLQYLTPYVGTTVGEYFMEKGHHAFIVYDDLSNHAVAYRQMALLLRRPPGREAFPGDIFYVHSSLLERSAQMSKDYSGGSLTSFPVIETQCGDVSSYIPTNVISITDGQIYLDTNLFNKGLRPAIHMGLSVSRVGSVAQNVSIKVVSRKLKVQMSEFNKIFGSSAISTDIDPALAGKLAIGLRLREIFKQRNPRSYYEQLMIGYSSSFGFTSDVNPNFIMLYYNLLFNINFIKQLIQKIETTPDFVYAADYLVSRSPFNHLFNFFLKLYSIEKVRVVMSLDAFF